MGMCPISSHDWDKAFCSTFKYGICFGVTVKVRVLMKLAGTRSWNRLIVARTELLTRWFFYLFQRVKVECAKFVFVTYMYV